MARAGVLARRRSSGSPEDGGYQKEHHDDAEHAPEPKDLHQLPSWNTLIRGAAATSTGMVTGCGIRFLKRRPVSGPLTGRPLPCGDGRLLSPPPALGRTSAKDTPPIRRVAGLIVGLDRAGWAAYEG